MTHGMPTGLDLVAAVYLLRRDGSALLQHRDDKLGLRHANLWVPPGGHCEYGETPLDCARREFLEETCYLCKDLHFLTTLIDEPGRGWKPYELHVFWAAYDESQSTLCREGQALEFISRAQAKNLAMPDFIGRLWDRAWEAHQRLAGVSSRP